MNLFIEKNKAELNASARAEQMGLAELESFRIEPNSPAGIEFMSRVFIFGIMGVQPPRPELNEQVEISILHR